MNIKEIQDLIKFVAKSGVNEVEIEQKDFKITIKAEDKSAKEEKQIIVQAAAPAPAAIPAAPAPAPVAAAPAAAPAPAAEAPAASDDSKYVQIKSPMIGTFYRSSGPDKDPFVQVGDTITAESTVCIIEAMKLFNDIEAELSGKIVKILVDDASPVEYDQPLFLVDPS
ncbi:MAG: acetyl-CoA carboxylase biotin carboxyl carrier protein [Fluviicola sp. XM-24bin1]|jgi:acetyl-CoA carboxylase biotin carboxyl carrier protein|nr:MAG: acetyl-CoA carboxylase biotin carboxyl carrier protein [Fluviicola sp. XM-24bin1]